MYVSSCAAAAFTAASFLMRIRRKRIIPIPAKGTPIVCQAPPTKKRGWFDVVHIVVWGPSAKLLTEDKELQKQMQAMREAGVVTEACIACARNYGVVDELKALGLDVRGMGPPLSERLQADWKVLTF